jgi:CBS domain-containing protein
MRALDVMTKTVLTVSPKTTVQEAARLFADNHVSGAPVVDESGHVVGMVTEGDLLRRIETGTQKRRHAWWLELLASNRVLAQEYVREHAHRIEDVMNKELISVEETTELAIIADLLERNRIKRVPVLRDGALVGIVSRSNLIRALASVSTATAPANAEADRKIRKTVIDDLNAKRWKLAPESAEADKKIHTAIVQELNHQRWALPAENVIVHDGIVHLWGVITSREQGHAMVVAAENVPGVKRVENHMDFPVVIPAV